MKRLIIIILVLLLLSGGLGALTVMKIIPDVLGVNVMMAGLMGTPTDDADHAEPPPPDYGPAPVFVQVPQLAVPVIDGGLSRGHLVLAVRLSIDPEAVVDVKRALPRLVDAYLTGLMEELPKTLGPDGRLDLARVKAEMNAITESVLAGGKIRDVVLQNAYLR